MQIDKGLLIARHRWRGDSSANFIELKVESIICFSSFVFMSLCLNSLFTATF